MVYCGRPSGGCYACRERKSRCDKLPEGCTQCKKAKRECPGYRQLGDVIFHNESEKVVRKAKAKEAKNKAKRDAPKAIAAPAVGETMAKAATRLPDLEEEQEEEDVMDQSLAVMQHYRSSPSNLVLLPPIEDIATGFFVSSFVTRAEGESVGPSRFDYLGDIYRNHSMDEGLLSSMRAVGFASYAHASQSPTLLHKARHQYTQAIQHTNKSLRSAEAAKNDTTLLSILILGIFETITGCQQRSLKDWSQHINGAAAVISLRGAEQIQSIAGRRMLFQVTSNLLIICLARGRALPPDVAKFTKEAVDLIVDPDPALIVQRTMMQVTQLRADVISGALSDLQTIMDEAIKLDCLLLALSEDPPPGWEYQTIYTDIKSSYIYNGRYHIYADCWMAQLWNALRTVRVILNEEIRDVLLKGFSSKPPIFPFAIHTAQFQLSTDTLYELQNDILSSVPQHLFTMPALVSPSPKFTSPHSQFQSQSQASKDKGKGKETSPPPPTINDHIALQLRLSSRNQKPHPPPTKHLFGVAMENDTEAEGEAEEEEVTTQTIDSHMLTQLSHILSLPTTCPSSTSSPPRNQHQAHPSHPSPAFSTFGFQTPTYTPNSHPTSNPTSPPFPSTSPPFPPNDPSQPPKLKEGNTFGRTYGGNFLLWPLWFAGIMDVATDEVRAFVVRNLRDIGEGLGIKQGIVLADMLEKGRMGEGFVMDL